MELIPYFATNKEWFRLKPEGGIVLTEKAPKKAIESYEEFIKNQQEERKGQLGAMKRIAKNAT